VISALILTKNEEQDLSGCLESVRWSDDINVYDSYSTDRTLEIAETAEARVTQRHFDSWSSHQKQVRRFSLWLCKKRWISH
jgi:glycosyltransferase involved in cell wall biosynthesis